MERIGNLEITRVTTFQKSDRLEQQGNPNPQDDGINVILIPQRSPVKSIRKKRKEKCLACMDPIKYTHSSRTLDGETQLPNP